MSTFNTTPFLFSSIKQSQSAVRAIFKEEGLIDLFVEAQVLEFSKIRKQHPEIPRNEAIKISMLNAGTSISRDKYSIKVCLGKSSRRKKQPQYDWLLDRQAFIIELRESGASLRQIKSAIYYRFHKKVSHSLISSFLKNHGGV